MWQWKGHGPIAQIDVIKNGKFVYAVKPGIAQDAVHLSRRAMDGEDSYYYVRVIQTDKNMAWASPIWVKRSDRVVSTAALRHSIGGTTRIARQ